MYSSELRSKIEIDQRRQLNNLIFVLLIVLFSVVTSAVAPQLLYEYVLQDVSVDQQLLVLQYIPVLAYVASFVAFVVAAFGFVQHGRRTRMYEQEMMLLQLSEDDCDCEDCAADHFDHEMEEEVEVEVVESRAAKPVSSVSSLSAAMSQLDGKSAPAKRGRPASKKKSKK